MNILLNTLTTKRNITIKRRCIFGSVALALTLMLRAPVAFAQFNEWWSPIPDGTLSSGPAVTSDGNALHVYARGMDNAIWYNFWSDITGWLGWSSQGGVFTSKPSATRFFYRKSHRAVVGKGTDNFIWIRVNTHTTSTGWKKIPGGKFNSAPAIAYRSPYLHVFARKSDKVIYWARNDVSSGYNHSGWSAWTAVNPDGLFSSEPAVVVSSGVELVLVARGLDNRYWVNRGFGSSWKGWNQIPDGIFSSGPAVSYRTGGIVDVFGKGLDDHIWVASVDPTDGSTPGFSQIPNGQFKSPPASVSMNSQRIDVLATGLDNILYSNTWSP
ncbi:MAG: hypothetical protein ACHBNF_12545 [Chromatiales bacterium]